MVIVRLEATVKLFVFSAACFSLSLIAMCLNPYAPFAFLCSGAFGFSSSMLSISGQSIFQMEAEPYLLGRVISLWSLAGGLAAITALPIGIVGDLVSMRVSLGIVAVVLMVMTVVVGAGRNPLGFLGDKRALRPKLEAEGAT